MKNEYNLPGINLFSDLIDLNTPVDSIEVHPVCFIDEQKSELSVCEPEEANFWSVYIHIPDNGLECIADCDSEKSANDLREMLIRVAKVFKHN